MPIELLRDLPSKLRTWQFSARAVLFRDRLSWRLVALLDPESTEPALGAAIDIGTTRIVISLVDLETGEELGQQGFDNPQRAIGPDVLTRIHHSGKSGGLEELQQLVIGGVNENIADLCRQHGRDIRDVYLVTGAGNTAMTHLFAGIRAYEIIKEPYIPCVNILDTLEAADPLGMDIHPETGKVFLFPNIGSYFGGDLIAGILYSNLDQKQDPCIMVDVGTNAEIVVGSRDWLIACAGAAGPALERRGEQDGDHGPARAPLDRVWMDDPKTHDICIHTIGDKPAVGICGSGMIDLAAALFFCPAGSISGANLCR